MRKLSAMKDNSYTTKLLDIIVSDDIDSDPEGAFIILVMDF